MLRESKLRFGKLTKLWLDRAVITVVCEVTGLDSKSSEVRKRIIWKGISQNTILASESETQRAQEDRLALRT